MKKSLYIVRSSGYLMIFNTDGGVTASGFIRLEAGDFDELGLTLIGKKHILRTWKELTSK